MKKILIMNNEMAVGGTEKVLLTLLKYIDKNRVDITLLLPSQGDEWQYKIPKDIKVKYMFKKNPRDFTNIGKRIYQYLLWLIPGFLIQNIIIKDKYDIYVSFKPAMVDYLKGAKGKKICWIHGTYEKDTNSKHMIKRLWRTYIDNIVVKSFNNCEKIACVSEASKQAFINTFDIDKNKVITLYNPNDVKLIRNRSKERISLNLNEGITMCAVGRMHPVKAFDRLINIAYKLKCENIKFNLIIIGDGEEYNKINLLVKEYNLEDSVYLIGYEENPYKYIVKSDFMVCSSISEAFSTVATEAIILKVPVVTTLCSGMEELLGPMECGLITDNNEDDLYYGIKKVITDKDLLKKLKQGAEKRSNDFDTYNLVKKIENILLED